MNLNSTIIPKGQQLNADDLLAGPRTIKINAVKAFTAEQPVAISFDGDDGRPYLPSKGMRRVLVAIWGSEGAAYVGRRLTLYCDKEVTFGPDKTGGIRISHASDIAEPMEIALTVKRGKRKPFTVLPLVTEKVAEPAPLVDLPEAWESWTAEQRGDNRANKGVEHFRAWWSSLSKADRESLKGKTAEWKSIAEAAGANK